MYSSTVRDLVTIAEEHDDLNQFFKRNRDLGRVLKEETSFLPGKAYARERLWYVANNTDTAPKCKCCEKSVKWHNLNRCHNTYCSSKCANKDDAFKQKKQATNMERYGVPHSCMNDQVRKKQQTTLKQTHGVEYPFQSTSIRSKAEVTNMERYGVPHSCMNSEVRKKQKQTLMKNYGVDHPSKNSDIQNKRRKTNLERYGVEESLSAPTIRNRQKQTMMQKYGVDNSFKSPIVQEQRLKTMMDKYGVGYVTQRSDMMYPIWRQLIGADVSDEQAQSLYELLHDKVQLESLHVDDEQTIRSIAKQLGLAPSTVGLWFKVNNIVVKRFPVSQPERDLTQWLRDTIDDEVITNDRTLIAPYELDFVIPAKKLAIEFNGNYWHSELNGKHKNYHLSKTKKCNQHGYHLIHIREDQWINHPEMVKSRLLSKLGASTRIYARQCEIREVSTKEKGTFLEQSHIQGACGSSVNLGLYKGGELVCLMTFGTARFNKDVDWELIRYCNRLNTTVVGGAGKLFKHFITHYSPSSIVSYCDLSWNDGGMYRALGFKHLRDSDPCYYYFKRDNCLYLYHRSTFQKHKLEAKLDTFDPTLTEWRNMQNNGYDRIWDCGNSVWMWVNQQTS